MPARWYVTWTHALAVFYRARLGPARLSHFQVFAALLIWGLFLVGTGLGAAAYPQATDVVCDWFSCRYPLLEENHPLEVMMMDVLQFVGGLFGRYGCLTASLVLLVGFVTNLVKRVRAPQSHNYRALLAQGWENGALLMLTASPLGADGLVRLRFLIRLYYFWRQRFMIAAVLGTLAAVIVGTHILFPIFWWLGSVWQWVMQVILVLLWCIVVVLWLINLAALNTLQEAAFSSRTWHGLDWRLVPAVTIIGMIAMPPLLTTLYVRSFGYLSYHDGNVHNVVFFPIAAAITAAVFAVINYHCAHWIFRTRLGQASPG